MVIIALTTVFTLYVAAATMLYFTQTSIIFPRRATGPISPRPPEAPTRVLWIQTDSGERVEAWFIPGAGRAPDSPGPAVILAHGNATLIDHASDTVALYVARGVSVMLPEYRGYGRSEGLPSERGIVSDFVAAYDLLREQPEVQGDVIFGHGRSLGGGVIAQLAARRSLVALVIESSFTSVAAMARKSFMPGFICRHPFRTDSVLREYAGPVLLMHGTEGRAHV